MSELLEHRRTKIVCTIGPSTSSPEMLRRLIEAGMNVARLNFSHGDHEGHKLNIDNLRRTAAELGREIGILQDLAGPKIRLGEFEERRLAAGEVVRLTPGRQAVGNAIPVNYPYLIEDVEIHDRILLADGQVELVVQEKDDNDVTCRVVVGGALSSRKGVNLPASNLRISSFTDKDRSDLEFGLSQGVDFVALSFVRHEKDLAPLREMISKMDRPPLLIAKIEKPQALERLTEIMEAVEGVMVARGDLGVEMPVEEVPVIQKRIISEARRASKVVITATQMLGSMVGNPRPSRAEVTDVSNAVLDGTDAVMLSDETAMGKYPIEAVTVLDKVCRYTEPQIDSNRFLKEKLSPLLPATEAAISRAAALLAKDLNVAGIVAATASGSTARLISRFRQLLPVIGASTDPRTCRQLCLSWGVVPAAIPPSETIDDLVVNVRKWARENSIGGPGDSLILTAGIPLQVAGTTNLLKVIQVEGPPEAGN